MNHKQTQNKKEKIDKQTVKRLFAYLWEYKIRFIVVIICILISSLTSIASSLFLGTLIDKYIVPLLSMSNPDFSNLFKFILMMATIYATGILASFLYTRTMVVISQNVFKKVRDDMFVHMQKLPIKYFDTNSTGDIMSRYTNDTDTLRQLISQSIPQALAAIVTIIGVLIAMFSQSIPLTIVMFFIMFFMMNVAKTIGKKSGKYFGMQQAALGDINGYIEEMINGQKVIKVFCHEEKSKNIFDIKNEELRKNSTNANKFANLLMPIMYNLGIMQYVFLAIIGGILVITGFSGLTIGKLIAFLQLSKSFNMPISQISQQINSIIMAFAGAKRIFNILDEKQEEDKGYVTLVNVIYENGEIKEVSQRTGNWAWKHPHKDGTVTYTKLEGKVSLENVDFGYNPEKLVLKNINIYAKPGQKIAFVGATGAGKTTITNLINKFYHINAGKIRYDNINIDKIKKEDLRLSLGVVLQDTHLFTGTVMENIKYGNLNATDEECIEAAKKANAHLFIELLPKGYDTILEGNGSSLSQGQRQLLAIARAIIANPPVMILDEATSSIDTHTEAIVQEGMDKLMHKRTVFVIAHRLSTIQNSDLIVVLDKGEIIEKGNHNELIEKKGRYYQLYTGAFKN